MTQNIEPNHKTLLTALDSHLETGKGLRTAYTFLSPNEESVSTTYAALDERARSIASNLLDHAQPGDRALMMYSPGLAFIDSFIACLYAGIIAVPAYPPKKNRNAERIVAIAKDCNPRLLLCNRETQNNIVGEFADSIDGSKIIVTDEIQTSSQRASLPQINSRQIAFLQYTSGSTAAPKGVMITHDNIVANEISIQQNFKHDQDSVMVSWLPMFHDMGLIGGILQPLFVGFSSVLMAPNAFLRDPAIWLRAITEFRGTSAGGPNFAYGHCVRRVSEEQKRSLNLSTWKTAYNGAEPVRAETIEMFSNAFKEYGFRKAAFFPCYGLAEATLFVSGGPPLIESPVVHLDAQFIEQNQLVDAGGDTARVQTNVSCVRIGDDLVVQIVDPETHSPCAATSIGEIWISGESIAGGYWQRVDDTEQTFHAKLIGDERSWFRSGDFGFLRCDELYVTGRLKDLIIIRGRNIYPQDIEKLVEQYFDFIEPNNCAAFSVEVAGEERLVVVAEGNREMVRWSNEGNTAGNGKDLLKTSIEALRSAIVEQFGVVLSDLVFVRPTTFSRTSSGKVQRRISKMKYLENTLAVTFSSTRPNDELDLNEISELGKIDLASSVESPSISKSVAALLAKELKIPVSKLDPNRSFFTFGLDSIGLAGLALSLQELSPTISIETLQKHPTLNELTAFLSKTNANLK